MYKLIWLISYFIRNVILPNPFESIITDSSLAMFFNMSIGEGIIHILSFNMCGIFYSKNSCPEWGSIIYFLFYIVNTIIIMCLGHIKLNFQWLAIIYLIVIIFIYVILLSIKNKKNKFY